jgi:transposase-like protein
VRLGQQPRVLHRDDRLRKRSDAGCSNSVPQSRDACARGGPGDRWYLDEMVLRIVGRRMYLWRAVDQEGEILDLLIQPRRDKRVAVRLMRKLLKNPRAGSG